MGSQEAALGGNWPVNPQRRTAMTLPCFSCGSKTGDNCEWCDEAHQADLRREQLEADFDDEEECLDIEYHWGSDEPHGEEPTTESPVETFYPYWEWTTDNPDVSDVLNYRADHQGGR